MKLSPYRAIGRTAVVVIVIVVVIVAAAAGYYAYTLSTSSKSVPYTAGLQAPTLIPPASNYVAMDQNLFPSDATIQQFSTSSAIIQALSAGTIQVSQGTSDAMVAGICKGGEYKIVAFNSINPQTFGLFVKTSSPYKSITDLKGQTVTVAGKGSEGDVINSAAFNSIGYQAGVNYTLTYSSGGSAVLAAILSGSVAAGWGIAFNWVNPILSGQIHSIYNYSITAPLVIAATNQFIKDHPSQISAFLDSMFKANSIFLGNKTLQTSILIDKYSYNATSAAAFLPALEHEWQYQTSGIINSTLIQDAKQTAVAAGSCPSDYPVSNFTVSTFAKIVS